MDRFQRVPLLAVTRKGPLRVRGAPPAREAILRPFTVEGGSLGGEGQPPDPLLETAASAILLLRRTERAPPSIASLNSQEA